MQKDSCCGVCLEGCKGIDSHQPCRICSWAYWQHASRTNTLTIHLYQQYDSTTVKKNRQRNGAQLKQSLRKAGTHPTINVFSSMNEYVGTSKLYGAGPLRTRPEVS